MNSETLNHMPQSEFSIELPTRVPLLIVVSGPSGVGKDVTLKEMQARGAPFHFLVTNTTRPRRPHEEEGVDYHFVTQEEFNSKLERDEFLEHAVVYGYQYGNLKTDIYSALAQGTDVIMRIDPQGAATIRQKVSGAIFIFLISTLPELEARLRARKTESEEALQIRLRLSAHEMQDMPKFDYVVINRDGELDRAVNDILAIIRAEKLRTHPREIRFI